MGLRIPCGFPLRPEGCHQDNQTRPTVTVLQLSQRPRAATQMEECTSSLATHPNGWSLLLVIQDLKRGRPNDFESRPPAQVLRLPGGSWRQVPATPGEWSRVSKLLNLRRVGNRAGYEAAPQVAKEVPEPFDENIHWGVPELSRLGSLNKLHAARSAQLILSMG